MKKGYHFKVEVRKDCLICGAKLDSQKRQRTFCSEKCRMKHQWIKYKDRQTAWQREYRFKKATESPNKKKCAICGGWYVQVGSHIVQVHKMTARDYRKEFDFPLKRGIISQSYRELKRKAVFENGTVNNLLTGKSKRFKKNDVRAKIVTGWKGRAGNIGYKPNEYYGY